MTVKTFRQSIISGSALLLATLSLQAQAQQPSEFAILAGMASTLHAHCMSTETTQNSASLERELRNLAERNNLTTEFEQGIELGLRKVRSANSVEICSTNAQQNYLIVLASVVAPLQRSASPMLASN